MLKGYMDESILPVSVLFKLRQRKDRTHTYSQNKKVIIPGRSKPRVIQWILPGTELAWLTPSVVADE